MAKTLTRKQEKFAEVLVETGNASEAYRQAYDVENMKPETIGHNAYTLRHHNQIETKVEALRKRHETLTRLDAATLALEVHALAADEGQKGSTRVAAYALLAKQFPEFNERRSVDLNVTGQVDVRAMLALKAELAAIRAGDTPSSLAEALSKPLLSEPVIDADTEE